MFELRYTPDTEFLKYFELTPQYTVTLCATTGIYTYTSDSIPDFESARLCKLGWLIMAGVKDAKT
jgi:hypothetical protein